MKIEVNINRKFLFILGGILVLAWVFVFVGAFGGTSPSTVGHTTGEIDWNTEINSIKVKEIDYTGDNFKIKDVDGSGVDRITIDGTGKINVISDLQVNGRLFVVTENSFCNIVNTGASGDAFQGKITLSLIINGRNICTDLQGCTYNIIKYKISDPNPLADNAAKEFASDSPLVYRQSSTVNSWYSKTGAAENRGVNGNTDEEGINVQLTGKIRDDENDVGFWNANSVNNWVVEDTDGSFSYIFTVCDF